MHPLFARRKNVALALALASALALLPLMAALSLPSLSNVDAAPDVIGGQPADPGEYPWQVYVEIGPRSNSGQCGGSLIHPKWVMTAAHCFFDDQNRLVPGPFLLSIGDHDLQAAEGSEQNPVVAQYFLHEGFNINNPNNEHDIALLELQTPVVLDDRIAPVALVASPQDDALVAAGREATVIGWGGIDRDAVEISTVLLELSYTIETCASGLGSVHLCMSTSGGIGNCDGDSGGPLMVRAGDGTMRQAGIASFGTSARCASGQDVYTRVSEYHDWIRKTTDGALDPELTEHITLPMLLAKGRPNPRPTAEGPSPTELPSPTSLPATAPPSTAEPTATLSATPVPRPLSNGNFEEGPDDTWEEIENGERIRGSIIKILRDLIPYEPYEGLHSAYFGKNILQNSLSQTFTIDKPVLRYAYKTETNRPCRGNEGFRVSLDDVKIIAYDLCTETDVDWTIETIDVENWMGQTVDLEFFVEQVRPYVTNVLVDAVSLEDRVFSSDLRGGFRVRPQQPQ